jgi:PPOX class probable F420-dependent enzyme
MPRTIATNTDVDRENLLEFVRPRHKMVLLTPRADGGWQGSPVTAGVDDQGRIVISTYPERAKAANVKRRGRAAVIVLSDDFNGPWVQVDGDAELIELPDAVEPLVDYFRSISGEHPTGTSTARRWPSRARRSSGSPPPGGARWPPVASRPLA